MKSTLAQYKQVIGTGQYAKEEEYWMNKLSGQWEKSGFPVDYIAPDVKTKTTKIKEKETVTCEFPGDISSGLIKLSNKSDLRMHVILVTGLTLLLHKYSYQGNRDIILGTPVLKQDIEAEFINTFLVLKNPVENSMTFKELLLQVRQTIVEATANQNYPLETLPHRLNLPVSPHDFLLFDVAILLKNIHAKEYLQHINPAMIFSFFKNGESLEGEVEYEPARYEKTTVERLCSHLYCLFREALFKLDRAVSDIDIIPQDEKEKILYHFNHTHQEYPEQQTIHELFEEQVKRFPGHVALVYNDKSLTYGELNRKANRLACFLRSEGVTADAIVGLMVSSPLEMIVGIMGILKAGGAYLPIDTGYPGDRIKYIIENSRLKRLVSDRRKDYWGNISTVIDINDSSIYAGDSSEIIDSPNLPGLSQSFHAAYVIYTSGTTGRPRGIVVEHRQAVNTLVCRREEYKMNDEAVSLQLFSYAFDGFVTSFFTPVISGAEVVLVDEGEVRDIKKMRDVIRKNRVTHFISIPVLYEALIESLSKDEAASLKVITLAGEKLSPLIPETTRKTNENIEIVNEYGVTEAAVMSTLYRHQEKDNRVKIGGPIWNTAIYIFDSRMRPQTVGVWGELCISGIGVARGYLNNPELTAQKFQINNAHCGQIPNPSPIYRTGDLARWLPDGNIEFNGRIDNQVKLRGFRVELAEIESQLLKHKGIKNAVVVAKEDKTGDKYLCAYMIPDPSYWEKLPGSGKTLAASRLKQYLAMTLPGYMIPSYFVEIEEIPVTPNGKTDRKALPEPEFAGTTEYEAPQDDIEKALVNIWQEVLRAEKIGIDDNFFDLGGDSIKSIQIAARMRKYRLELKVKDLFSTPTIRQLGNLVKEIDSEIPQEVVSGNVQLTPPHLWFLDNNSIHMRPFNQTVILYKKDGFDETILEKVFARLTEHHDALRMLYIKEGEQTFQWNRGIETEEKLFDLEIINLEDSKDIAVEIEKQGSRIQESIDPTERPLVKLGMFKTAHGHHLLIAIHHFVTDGVSWRILLEDLSLGLQQAEKGEDIVFQQKTHSFKYWADKLKEYAESKAVLKEIEYWKKVEETNLEPFPVDHRIGKELKKLGNTADTAVNLNQEHTAMLLKEVNRAYNTEINDILLTALGLAVKEWAGLEKVAVNLEGHGREEIMKDVNISRTIGWFTAAYPIVMDMTQSGDLAYIIKFIKETLRKIPNKGIGYGILKYLTPPEKREELQFCIKPGIGFNYLGQLGQENSNDSDGSHHDGSGIYEFSPMNGGGIISPAFKQDCPIEISGILVNQKLFFTFSYNKYEHEKESIKKLADSYKSNLIKIVRHCSRKDESELTPSDLVVDDTELSLEVLNEIKEFTDLNIEE